MNNKKNFNSRFQKDFEDYLENPSPGIEISPFSNDSSEYTAEITMNEGPHEGMVYVLSIKETKNYPFSHPEVELLLVKDPIGTVLTGEVQEMYSKTFHKVLSEDVNMKKKWTPTFTIESLLLQLQVSLSEAKLQNLSPKPVPASVPVPLKDKSSDEKKHRPHKIAPSFRPQDLVFEGKKPSNPYNINDEDDNDDAYEDDYGEKKKSADVYDEKEDLYQALTCSVLKKNYKEDSSRRIILGYPILVTKSNSPDYYPVPELVSKEGFESSIKYDKNKYLYRLNEKLREDLTSFDNAWIPIYIDEDNYDKNVAVFKESLNELRRNKGQFNEDFIIEVLPKLLTSAIKGMVVNNSLSKPYLRCFFHITHLLQNMIKKFGLDITEYLEKDPENHLLEKEDILVFLINSNRIELSFMESTFFDILKDNTVEGLGSDDTKKMLKKIAISDYFINKVLEEKSGIYPTDRFLNKFSHTDELVKIVKDNEKLRRELRIQRGDKFGQLTKEVEKAKSQKKKVVYQDLYPGEDDFDEDAYVESKKKDYEDEVGYYDMVLDMFTYEYPKFISCLTFEERKKIFFLLQTFYSLDKTDIYTNGGLEEEEKIEKEKSMTKLFSQLSLASKKKFIKYLFKSNQNIKLICVLVTSSILLKDNKFRLRFEKNKGTLLFDQMKTCITQIEENLKDICSFKELGEELVGPSNYYNFDLIKNDINFVSECISISVKTKKV